MIIAVESIDAGGKQTQTKLLAEYLEGVRIAFPCYETPVGQAIFNNLTDHWKATDKLENAYVLQCMMTANRLELVTKIEFYQKSGVSIVFDRYVISALVYGKLDGLPVEWIERIQAQLPQPDINILIDITVEESFKRRPERRDRYESDKEFLYKVRQEYLNLFKERGYHIVDGIGTVEEVHERILRLIPAQAFSL